MNARVATDVARAESEGFVHLVAIAPLHVDVARVVAVLAGNGQPWPGGELLGPPVGGTRSFAVDLRLRVGGEHTRLATFGKAAFLDLGIPRRIADGCVAEVSWRASTAAPLFPVFAGVLIVRPHELRVEGLYAPPGGPVGRVADRVLLHAAANGTARWLLGELDRAALGFAG